MNLVAPPRLRLQVEIVLDLVCPWCYLGTRRLTRALRARPDIAAELSWLPFLLNPDLPVSGLPRQEYLVRKFGGEERARRLQATLADLGRAEGIGFRFDLIRRMPNSLDAHRLVRWAAMHGMAGEMVERLFTAFFTEGQDIGDPSVLTLLAAEIGLDPLHSRRFLASGAEAATVHAENLRAHRIGISGVPCFVLNGRHAIAGAQEAEVLDRMFGVALADQAP
ncbi:MAG: DsbA family oxidoreductase [Acetobacteraceae bacterium]|nr:DsbA family oxidoreductase [Acetobacteraceae bacterium]